MVPQTASHREGASAAGSYFSTALARRQVAIVIVLGIVFWLIAALVVRFGSLMGFFGPSTSAIAFILGIPICWLSVRLIAQIARLKAGQILPGIALGLIAATACDGLALTWARWLYGFDPALITFGAAWILWGVGLFLLFAYLGDYQHTSDVQ